ncbi:hypothetical protein ABTQ08_21620, partial [Acinetobacter baumannii]
ASAAKIAPIKIAEAIASRIRQNKNIHDDAIRSLSVAPPGFLNFQLGTYWLCRSLQEIHKQGAQFGRTNIGNGRYVLIEYVSAN